MPGVFTITYACPTTSEIFVVGDLIGTNSEQLRFRSRTTSCSGAITNTGCQIDITYSFDDANFFSGIGSISIAAGSSQTIATPSGEPITNFTIESVSWNGGSCAGYNPVITACGNI